MVRTRIFGTALLVSINCFFKLPALSALVLVGTLVGAQAVETQESSQSCVLYSLSEHLAFPKGEAIAFQELSAKNISSYHHRLQPLSADEQKLAQTIQELPLTVSTRRSESDMHGVAKRDGIIPRHVLSERGILAHTRYQAPTEEDLFGASHWSYATISASGWTGNPNYGEVVNWVKSDYWKKHSWATSTSDLKIYEKYLNLPRSNRTMNGVPPSELAAAQAAFKSHVTTPENYSRWIAYDVISYLRSHSEEVQRRFFSANKADLVKLLNKYQLGFLEAKLPGIPISAIQKITVKTRSPYPFDRMLRKDLESKGVRVEPRLVTEADSPTNNLQPAGHRAGHRLHLAVQKNGII